MTDRYPGLRRAVEALDAVLERADARGDRPPAGSAARAALLHDSGMADPRRACATASCRSRIAPPIPLPAFVDEKMHRGMPTDIVTPRCRRRERRGDAASRRWTRRRRMRTARASRIAPDAPGRPDPPHAIGRTDGRGLGRHAVQAVLRTPRHRPTSSTPITRTRVLERDRLRWTRQSARLCPHGFGPTRSVGAGGSRPGRRRGAPEQPPCRLIRSPRRAPMTGRAPDVFRRGGWVPMRQYRRRRGRWISSSSAPAPAAGR